MHPSRSLLAFVVLGIVLGGLSFLHASLIWNSSSLYDSWLVVLEIILIIALAAAGAKAFSHPVFYLLSAIAVFVILFFALSIMPTYSVFVRDVFGDPIERIQAAVIENRGDKNGVPGTRAVKLRQEILLTDADGRMEIPGKIYFGFRKPESLSLSLNRLPLEPEAAAEAKLEIDRRWDGKEILLGEKNEVILSPLKIDYETCFALGDPEARSECLPYALFYSAVKDVNPAHCKQFELDEPRRALEFFSHRQNIGRPFELEYECMTFVGGVLKRDSGICKNELDMELRKFKAECVSLTKPSDTTYCDTQDAAECVRRKAEFMQNPKAYLCERSGGGYANPALGILRHVSELYRDMFCEL